MMRRLHIGWRPHCVHGVQLVRIAAAPCIRHAARHGCFDHHLLIGQSQREQFGTRGMGRVRRRVRFRLFRWVNRRAGAERPGQTERSSPEQAAQRPGAAQNRVLFQHRAFLLLNRDIFESSLLYRKMADFVP